MTIPFKGSIPIIAKGRCGSADWHTCVIALPTLFHSTIILMTVTLLWPAYKWLHRISHLILFAEFFILSCRPQENIKLPSRTTRVYFTHSRCILSCINGYISNLSAEHDLTSITNIVDRPFFFFLLVLSVSIRFLRDYTLLHFYFSWLVEICIKDQRSADGRAEQSNSGVLHACCGSERRWVNRAPRWRPVPRVIPCPDVQRGGLDDTGPKLVKR